MIDSHIDKIRGFKLAGLAVLFLVVGGLIGGSAYVAFLPAQLRVILRVAMPIITLVIWLILVRSDQSQEYRELAAAFFAVSLGLLIAHFIGTHPAISESVASHDQGDGRGKIFGHPAHHPLDPDPAFFAGRQGGRIVFKARRNKSRPGVLYCWSRNHAGHRGPAGAGVRPGLGQAVLRPALDPGLCLFKRFFGGALVQGPFP